MTLLLVSCFLLSAAAAVAHLYLGRAEAVMARLEREGWELVVYPPEISVTGLWGLVARRGNEYRSVCGAEKAEALRELWARL